MELSVIILNYNAKYFLRQCLLSVEKALVGISSEIIVVDNASEDGSVDFLEKEFLGVKWIRNGSNDGFSRGNNIGVAASSGRFICVLNPDTVVAEDSFEKVLGFAKQSENLGIIGCRMIDGAGNFLPESKRGVPSPWVAWSKMIGLYKVFSGWKWANKYYFPEIKEAETGRCPIQVGAFMFMERQVFDKLGGFDENNFMYWEDTDLSYRSHLLGLDNYYYSGTTIIHYKGECTLKDRLYQEHFRDGMLFFYNKHFKDYRFFMFLMKLGADFFSWYKKEKSQTVRRKEVRELVFVTKNELEASEKSLFGKRMRILLLGKGKIEDVETERVKEYWVDANEFSFGEIIRFIEQNKGSKSRFKILTNEQKQALGSDNSMELGEVLVED